MKAKNEFTKEFINLNFEHFNEQCDRESTSKPESQTGFIKFIVQPTFQVIYSKANMISSH